MRGTDGPDPDAKPDPDADAAPSLPAPRVAPRAAAAAAASGPAPDVTSFNTVMAGLASSGRHARANFVLAEMRAAGLEPDEITFATLIHACTEANNCRAAEVRSSCPAHSILPLSPGALLHTFSAGPSGFSPLAPAADDVLRCYVIGFGCRR